MGDKHKPLESIGLPPVRKKNLSDEIADLIRKKIFDGTFKPGDKLPPEREFARKLKVNRGSLREALKKLQQLGLVAIKHGDGTRVLDFFQTASIEILQYLFSDRGIDKTKLISDIMHVRKLICLEIIRLAGKNGSKDAFRKIQKEMEQLRKETSEEASVVQHDYEFYEKLNSIAGNMIFNLMLNTVKPPFKFFKPIFGLLFNSEEDVYSAHKSIIRNLEEGKVDEAVKVAENYLSRSAELIVKKIKKENRTDEDIEKI